MKTINILCCLLSIFVFSTSLVLAKDKKEKPGQAKLIFKANKSSLWFKHGDENNSKEEKNVVEVSLPGKVYDEPRLINDIAENKIDRSTPEGLVASYFSASEKGDIEWITENFVNEEKEKIKSVFQDKSTLKKSQKSAKNIKTKHVTGEAEYKGYKIVFVEENFGDKKIVAEALACKKEENEWKITNALSNDKTFDIVFAAVSSGEVDYGKRKNTDESIKTKIRPPEIIIEN
ncbi:MAG: hypothetical protein A3B68_09955 [Candidatus Melainabacteria bacterium RIFCSPHIGHO2_02_FULL_34_12]|nr:MAG: hypothetical protein A3B68_09955 [Candidatus Melainabacteria bacterium RIFCSPHIGHO2_02_FULL_34_12]